MSEEHSGLALHVARRTDIGRRRKQNQDSYGDAESGDGARLFCVADGIGGCPKGDVASQAAVEAAVRVWTRAGGEAKHRLMRVLEEANDAVNDIALESGILSNMGTTMVALAVTDDTAWVAYAGDSRAYRLRRGALERLTVDHTGAQSLVTAGKIKPEQVEKHRLRNSLTQYLGASLTIDPAISQPLELAENDTFLLCSDGLTAVLKDDDIARFLTEHGPDDAVNVMVDMANERGGPDNTTIYVVRYGRHAEALGRSETVAPAGGLRQAIAGLFRRTG